MRFETEKLIKIYKEHGSIVVGLDFDDTVYPLRDDDYIVERCEVVRELIKQIRHKVTLCLWTVAADWSMKYKLTIIREVYNIKPDYINCSPLAEPDIRKPFFNISKFNRILIFK